jgi:hypothetical protein
LHGFYLLAPDAHLSGRPPDEPVTFPGFGAAGELPEGSEVCTGDRLGEMIPE